MEINKDQVIVLNIVKHKDRNLIIKGFTKNNGLQSFFTTLPKGKSKKGKNFIQPFSLLELVYQKSSKSDLYRIKESSNLDLLIDTRTSVVKNAMAFLLAEIYGQCIREESQNTALFEFVENQILTLEKTRATVANYHLHALVQLMGPLGILPEVVHRFQYFDIKEGEFIASKPSHPHFLEYETAELFQQLIILPWEDAQKIALNGKTRSDFMEALMRFYQYHLPGFQVPKSLDVLQEVFAE